MAKGAKNKKAEAQIAELETDAKAPRVITRDESARRIVKVADGIFDDIMARRKPEMKVPVRSLANVKYDLKRGHFEIRGKMSTRTLTYNTVKPFAQSTRIVSPDTGFRSITTSGPATSPPRSSGM